MDPLAVRLARTGDAVDLTRNWIEVAHHYVELDPEAAQVPSTDGLVEFFEELLGQPRSRTRCG